MKPLVLRLQVDEGVGLAVAARGSLAAAWGLNGPTCAVCFGVNHHRYGPTGSPLCLTCRPSAETRAPGQLASDATPFAEAFSDPHYWVRPIRWSDYHVKRRQLCDECAAARQAGVTTGPLEQAKHRRAAGNTVAFLCHQHAELWRAEQTRRAA